MPPMDEAMHAFLQRYGRALSAGDLAGVVACWNLPALVVSDEGVQPVSAAAEVEAFFGGAIAWYRSQGMAATRPEDVRIVPLGRRVAAVDVTWSAQNAAGETVSTERSHYIVRLGEDGAPRVCVAVGVQE
ncbi:MAG TPA: hypothetical protein GX714_17200 [Chloroflexi bacterium]|jgi:hypothetical protein|nr:hypothetical protein [Chloroflexota bacterium]